MISPALAAQILASQDARQPFDEAMNEQAKGHALQNVARVGLATEDAISALEELLIELRDVRRQCDASLDKDMGKVARACHWPSAPYAVAEANQQAPASTAPVSVSA